MRKDRIASLTLRSIVWSADRREVLGHLLGDRRSADRAAAGTEILQVDEDGAAETRDIDAGMLVEILVFGRNEGRLDAVRNGLDRKIEAALTGIFGHQRAVAGMHARRYRRRVAVQDLIIWQVLGHMAKINGSRCGNAEHHECANAEEISNQSDHQPGTGIQLSFIYADAHVGGGPNPHLVRMQSRQCMKQRMNALRMTVTLPTLHVYGWRFS